MLLTSQMFSESRKYPTRDLEISTTQTTASIAIKHSEVTGKLNAERHQIIRVKPRLLKDTQAARENTSKAVNQIHELS